MVKVKLDENLYTQKRPCSPYRIDVSSGVGSAELVPRSLKVGPVSHLGSDTIRHEPRPMLLSLTTGVARKSLYLGPPFGGTRPRCNGSEDEPRECEILRPRCDPPLLRESS